MKKPIILFLIFSAFVVSCKKEIIELPPATQSGANTFGAKVNGTIWLPKGFGPFPADNLLDARKLHTGDIVITARNFSSSPNETELELFIKGLTGPGTYQLNTTVGYPTTAASYGYYIERNFNPKNEWITSASYTGIIQVSRYDTAAKIISGTFSFNALNLYNAPQPITVTEGRFDVIYE